MKKIKLLSIMLVMAIISLTIISCGEDYTNKVLENTMDNDDPSLENFCSYYSQTSEFDIDDVTLTFYLYNIYNADVEYAGSLLDEERWRDLQDNCGFNDVFLYFISSSNDVCEEYFIKQLEGDFYSGKYALVNGEPSYSEEFTIPEELFFADSGSIIFGMLSARVEDAENYYPYISCSYLYYKKIDSTIILSNTKFD